MDPVARLSPYFAVEKRKNRSKALGQKSHSHKGFDTGGRLTKFLNNCEVMREGWDGVLWLNPSLLNFKQENDHFGRFLG